MTTAKLQLIELKANEIRKDIVSMLLAAGSGHSAGSLDMADVFACLYFSGILNWEVDDPWNPNRDRVLLSAGHICPVWYATLAHAGAFSHQELMSLRKIDSRLQGHPHYRDLPGIENSAGSLGQGLSQAIGQALVAKMDGKNYYVFCIMSDGEFQEGQNWEALMFAGKNQIGNLTAIIDRNNIQIDGFTEDVMPIEPLADKLKAFGWNVLEVDGHNVREIAIEIERAKENTTGPTAIIAHTIPGKGVEFMQGKYEWHGKSPNGDEAKIALKELRTLGGKISSE